MKNQRKSADTILFASFSLSLVLSLIPPVAAQTTSAGKTAAISGEEAQLERASKALSHHDAKQAFQLATAVITANPRNAAAYFIRGKARAEYDDSKNALVDFSTGMRLNPGSADPYVYLTMAQAYLQLKEPERALHALQVGNLQKPNFELYKMSAGINNSLGDEKEALLDIEKALKFDPSSRTMLLFRASFYDNKHDYEHAIRDYSRVVEISMTKREWRDTNWLEATKKRANDYEKTGKKELARRDRETLDKEGSSWEKDLFEVTK
jgi:tetratricopeptide (TPR) repeat protein